MDNEPAKDESVERKSETKILDDRPAHKDLLDFGPYIETLLDIIRDPNTDTPLTIGLFGKWGSGKTSLMGFLKDGLSEDRFHAVWFDAWKYEKEGALWRALILRVLDELRSSEEKKDRQSRELFDEIEKLEQGLYHDLEWMEKGGLTIDLQSLFKGVTAAGKLTLSFLPGLSAVKQALDLMRAGKGDSGVSELIGAFRREAVGHHQRRLSSIEEFERGFSGVVRKHMQSDERLVVFVDDLDRCLPEKAIEVLEAIKLFLDVRGCIFVLGIDHSVIERGIKVKYHSYSVDEGADSERAIPIDGASYLEKIIQLPFLLPPIEEGNLKSYVNELIKSFPEDKGECATVFVKGLGQNPRKVKRALNIFMLLWRLAGKRAELKNVIRPIRLAKVVVLQHSHPELFGILKERPLLLRDIENHLRDESRRSKDAEASGKQARGAASLEGRAADPGKDKPAGEELASTAAPVDARLLPASLRAVLTLFCGEDEDACFGHIALEEIRPYFTLTATVASEPPAPKKPKGISLPQMVRVPREPFPMGTSEQQIKYLKASTSWAKDWDFEDERQKGERTPVDAYEIGKYPVTNQEYQVFIRDKEHRPPSHWNEDEYPAEQGGHPVVNVSWRDAMGYCGWLTERIRKAGHLTSERAVRLPTEAEWEKAACWGPDAVKPGIWPWGDDFDGTLCNTVEGGAQGTTAAGKYSPKGDSAYGVVDLAGNVWEWCHSLYMPYPYSYENDREDPNAGGPRVLRGGSWILGSRYARCAYRNYYGPGHFNYDVGFRLVLALSLDKA